MYDDEDEDYLDEENFSYQLRELFLKVSAYRHGKRGCPG